VTAVRCAFVVVLAVVGAPAAGAVVAVLAGADVGAGAACWANALIGRIATVAATNRLDMRVMVVFLFTGRRIRLVPAETDKTTGL
jgi:hypothetical protein